MSNSDLNSIELAERSRRALDMYLLPIADSDVSRHIPFLTPSTVVTYGWWRTSVALVRAILLLHDNDMDEATPTLRRSLIEHSMGAVWVARSGQVAIDALNSAHVQRLTRIRDALDQSDWKVIDGEVFDKIIVDTPKSSEATLLSFAHLFAHFGQQDLLAAWLAETSLSHPGLTSAKLYYQEDSTGNPRLLDHALEIDPTTPESAAGLLATIVDPRTRPAVA